MAQQFCEKPPRMAATANEGGWNEQTRRLRMKESVEPKKLLQVFAFFFNGSSIQIGLSSISTNPVHFFRLNESFFILVGN